MHIQNSHSDATAYGGISWSFMIHNVFKDKCFVYSPCSLSLAQVLDGAGSRSVFRITIFHFIKNVLLNTAGGDSAMSWSFTLLPTAVVFSLQGETNDRPGMERTGW